MKNLIIITMLIGLPLFGCADEQGILEPDSSQNENNVEWITLPESEGGTVEGKGFSVQQFINGDKGGTITLNESYPAKKGRRIEISAKLHFPSKCFDGEKLITMQVNQRQGHADFSPASTFYRDALYDLTISGLDLRKFNPDNVKFVYQTANRQIEVIKTAQVTVDILTGTLMVKNARLPHFSRYGFVK